MGRMEGKRCLVTGAGQGMGRAIAERFVAEGGTVVACDLSDRHFHDLPVGVQTYKLDVTDATAVAEVAAAHPRIDVLVNCVGYVAVGDVLECDEADFERSLRINMKSIYTTVRA